MSDGSYEVLFYRSPRGECFAEDFLDGLPAKVRGKILRWIEALETHGFVKKTGPVPVSELDRAQRLMQEWH